MVMHLGSVTIDGLSDQVCETVSTQNEGKDRYSALASVNVGLPSGSFVAVLLQGDEASFLSVVLEFGAW